MIKVIEPQMKDNKREWKTIGHTKTLYFESDGVRYMIRSASDDGDIEVTCKDSGKIKMMQNGANGIIIEPADKVSMGLRG